MGLVIILRVFPMQRYPAWLCEHTRPRRTQKSWNNVHPHISGSQFPSERQHVRKGSRVEWTKRDATNGKRTGHYRQIGGCTVELVAFCEAARLLMTNMRAKVDKTLQPNARQAWIRRLWHLLTRFCFHAKQVQSQ